MNWGVAQWTARRGTAKSAAAVERSHQSKKGGGIFPQSHPLPLIFLGPRTNFRPMCSSQQLKRQRLWNVRQLNRLHELTKTLLPKGFLATGIQTRISNVSPVRRGKSKSFPPAS
jgi:hypothetical protein